MREARGGTGRNRPWQAVARAWSGETPATAAPTPTRLAADALTDMLVEREVQRLRAAQAARDAEPAAWREATGLAHAQAWLSAEEADELCEQLRAVTPRGAARRPVRPPRSPPGRRPAGLDGGLAGPGGPDPARPGGRRMIRAAFRVPGFPRLFAGLAASMVGDSLMLIVLSMWVKTLTGSNAAAGVTFLLMTGPALLAPLLGYVVDRVPRRTFLVAANGVSALSMLPLLAVHDAGDVWVVYAVAACYGVSFVVVPAALNGLLKDLLPEAALVDVNASLSITREGLRLGGPLLGAATFAIAGGGTVALVDAATFLLAALAVASLRVRETPLDEAGRRRAGGRGGRGRALRPAHPGAAAQHGRARSVPAGARASPSPRSTRSPTRSAGRRRSWARSAPCRAPARWSAGCSPAGWCGVWRAGCACWWRWCCSASVSAGSSPRWRSGSCWSRRRCSAPASRDRHRGLHDGAAAAHARALMGRVSAFTEVLTTTPQALSIAVGAVLVTLLDYRVLFVLMAVGTLLAAAYLAAGAAAGRTPAGPRAADRGTVLEEPSAGLRAARPGGGSRDPGGPPAGGCSPAVTEAGRHRRVARPRRRSPAAAPAPAAAGRRRGRRRRLAAPASRCRADRRGPHRSRPARVAVEVLEHLLHHAYGVRRRCRGPGSTAACPTRASRTPTSRSMDR